MGNLHKTLDNGKKNGKFLLFFLLVVVKKTEKTIG